MFSRSLQQAGKDNEVNDILPSSRPKLVKVIESGFQDMLDRLTTIEKALDEQDSVLKFDVPYIYRKELAPLYLQTKLVTENTMPIDIPSS